MQKWLIYCGLICCNFLFQSSSIPHSIYIGQVNLNASPHSNTATLSVTIFGDDLKDALQNHFPKKDFRSNKNLPQQKKAIVQYINQYLTCTINQKKCKLVFQDFIVEGKVCHVHFNCKVPTQWSIIHIKANFLMELFPKQSNILKVQYGQETWIERLQRGREEAVRQFH